MCIRDSAKAASSSTATGAVPTANNGHSLELVDQEKALCQQPQTHRGRVTIGSQKDWIAARRARHVAPSKMGPMSSSGSSRLSRIPDCGHYSQLGLLLLLLRKKRRLHERKVPREIDGRIGSYEGDLA